MFIKIEFGEECLGQAAQQSTAQFFDLVRMNIEQRYPRAVIQIEIGSVCNEIYLVIDGERRPLKGIQDDIDIFSDIADIVEDTWMKFTA